MGKRFKLAGRFLLVLLMVALVGAAAGSINAGNAAAADSVDGYVALDARDPIEFGGTYIVYKNQRIELGENAVYVDGSLSDEVANKYKYVYNDIRSALSKEALKDGTKEAPMTVYIAPYVYWIDNPLATDTVEKTEGYGVPYGMVVEAKYLKLCGLTSNPENVVIAGNRGQSHASNGNYTMFRFNVTDLQVSNLTIGNYCSVDLVYPLKTSLNQQKRTSTITQAQLADQSGDKLFADNCNFISRLNLDPICGAGRSLYNKCHFESTDDALNGNAVYLECDFDFYGNRPLYSSYNTGSAFLNCTFNSMVMNVEAEPNQYFTKEGGTIIAVDCEYKTNYSIPFGFDWTKYPSSSLRCYQFNILHNGKNITLGEAGNKTTVDMTDKDVLQAYRIEKDGKVYYNTYNLLKGDDDWDPMNVKDIVTAAGKTDVSTLLTVSASAGTIESGVTTAELTSKVSYFYNKEDKAAKVTYSIDDAYKEYVKITDNGNGVCKVEGINNEDEEKKVVIYASTDNGLSGAVEITVKPSVLSAPEFITKPSVNKTDDGKLQAAYKLDLENRADMSLISWYRCTDANGSNPILVAVTRNDEPMYTYTLTAGDVGYYIMAEVAPKNIRSEAGTPLKAVYNEAVKVTDVKSKNMSLDFKNLPGVKQAQVIPGFWTVDSYVPKDCNYELAETDTPWVYGKTGNGCVGYGLYQATRGARLMYTPVNGEYGDMSLEFVVDPAKTAGQGFGSANQYMDVCIKFDTATLTGYGLRIVRTKAASNAVSFVLVKYDNGEITEISDKVIASCYMTGCTIKLEAKNNKLTAHVETPTAQLADQAASGWVHTVDLQADITANTFGGVAIQHTGTTGSGGWQNTTMLHSLNVVWAGENAQNPENPTTPETPTTPGAPNTGDSAPIVMLITAMILSAFVLCIKRKNLAIK